MSTGAYILASRNELLFIINMLYNLCYVISKRVVLQANSLMICIFFLQKFYCQNTIVNIRMYIYKMIKNCSRSYVTLICDTHRYNTDQYKSQVF